MNALGLDGVRIALAGRPLDPVGDIGRKLLAAAADRVHRNAARRQAVVMAGAQGPEVAGTQEDDDLVLVVGPVHRVVDAKAGQFRRRGSGRRRAVPCEGVRRHLQGPRRPVHHLVQFQRMVLSPLLYGIWLGTQQLLMHFFDVKSVWATGIGCVVAVVTVRVIHTWWMITAEAKRRIKQGAKFLHDLAPHARGHEKSRQDEPAPAKTAPTPTPPSETHGNPLPTDKAA